MTQKPSPTQDYCAPRVRKEPETGAYTLGYLSGYYLAKLSLASISPDHGRQAFHAGCEALQEAASKEPSIQTEFLKGLNCAIEAWMESYTL